MRQETYTVCGFQRPPRVLFPMAGRVLQSELWIGVSWLMAGRHTAGHMRTNSPGLFLHSAYAMVAVLSPMAVAAPDPVAIHLLRASPSGLLMT